MNLPRNQSGARAVPAHSRLTTGSMAMRYSYQHTCWHRPGTFASTSAGTRAVPTQHPRGSA